jgi:uncharacterized tellurite resistance protein B-like protein
MMSELNGPQTAADISHVEISQITEKLAMPNGFAKLTSIQRRLLLAAVLTSIVPVDGHVRKVEMEQLEKLLKQKFQFSQGQLQTAMAMASKQGLPTEVELLAKHLPELLSIEDRTQMIGMLWDLALCDHELHQREETLIYKVAYAAGVLRKRVAEQQSIASSRSGMRA